MIYGWHAMTRAEALQWTEQRLLLERHYWLFILGLNNSGTTLLVDLLKTHPLVRSLPNEGQYLTNALPLAPHLRRATPVHGTARCLSLDRGNDPEPALRIQYDWAAQYPQRAGILLEKSPPNSLRSRWLQHNFRPSRFVAINAPSLCRLRRHSPT